MTEPAEVEIQEALARFNPSGDTSLRACTASAWEGAPKRCRWCNGELTGRRKRWCSEDCVDEFGRNHWWSYASNEAKRRAGMKCEREGCDEYAYETHHTTPILGRHSQSGCHHHLDGLESLCKVHHLEVHHGPRYEQLGIEVA